MGKVHGSPTCLRSALTLNFAIPRPKTAWRYASHIDYYENFF